MPVRPNGIRYLQIEALPSDPGFAVVMKSFPEMKDGERCIGSRVIGTHINRATAEAAARVFGERNGVKLIPDETDVITIVRLNSDDFRAMRLSGNRADTLYNCGFNSYGAAKARAVIESHYTERAALIMPWWAHPETTE